MNTKKYLYCGLIAIAALTFSITGFSSPGSDHNGHAVKSIAKILTHVNHFPSSAEKKSLQKIADDTNNSAHVRAIAKAMINMQHSVSAEDKSQLMAIANDESADHSAREIASILANFMHKPSSADQQKLSKIMD